MNIIKNSQLIAFILMPFEDSLTKIYKRYVKPSLESLGYTVKRADDIYSATPILKDILNSIREADILIAELTGRNPNVFYELGRAHEKGKQVILICQKVDDVPFDLQHLRLIVYKKNLKGYETLQSKLIKSVKKHQEKTLSTLKKSEKIILQDITKELRDKIEEVKEIGRTRINDIIPYEPFANVLRMCNMIYKELNLIEDWEEVRRNQILFDFLHLAILLRDNPNEKVVLVQLLLRNIEEKTIADYRKLYERFSEYLDDPHLKKFLIENGYIYLFIEIFKKSRSFEDAGITSDILLKIKDKLDQIELEKITVAFMENDQNLKSFAAQKNIYEILDDKLYVVPIKYRDEFKKVLYDKSK